MSDKSGIGGTDHLNKMMDTMKNMDEEFISSFI